MLTRRIAAFAVLFLALGFLIASCSTQPNGVRIGVIAPFTGSGANYGQMAKQGLEIALDKINQGVPPNQKIQLIYEDDHLDPQTGKTELSMLTNVDKVVAVLGPFTSGVAMVVGPEAQRVGVPLISPTATNYRLRDIGDYFFRVSSSDNYQGALLARFAYDSLKARKVAILYMNTDYGFGLQKNFADVFDSLGGTIISTDAFNQGAMDFRAQLTKIKDEHPDLVFSPSNYSEMASILTESRQLGTRLKFLGSDGSFDPQLLTLAGKAADGFILSTQAVADTTRPVVSRFVHEFRQRYGSDPTPFASLWYDALRVVAVAVRQVEKDKPAGGLSRQNLKDALHKVEFDGVTGLTKFNQFGGVEKPFALFVVKDRQFVPLKQ